MTRSLLSLVGAVAVAAGAATLVVVDNIEVTDRFGCPEPERFAGSPVVAASGDQWNGAVAVRMCPADDVEHTTPAPGLPSPPVLEGADRLLGGRPDVGAASGPSRLVTCSADGGVRYGLAFYYADGTVLVAQGDTGGCGDGGRYVRFYSLLDEQQA